MNEILLIVGIVFGVLNLILFFKIWGMTNDIKDIKSRVINKSPTYDDIRRAYYKGSTLIAEDMLTEKLIDRLIEYKENGEFKHVDAVISQFEPTYKAMGLEIPEAVLKLKDNSKDVIR